jgi:MFS family permease
LYFQWFTGLYILSIRLGFSIGPVIGGWLIRHPIAWIGGSSILGRQSVTSVFWVAVACSFINLLLITFVFPESLDKEKRERAMMAYRMSGKKGKTRERALTLASGDPGSSSTDEEDNIEEVNRQTKAGRKRKWCTIRRHWHNQPLLKPPIGIFTCRGP